MCTLILKKPNAPGHPLQIFGNRDERLDREAEGFAPISFGKTNGWAPKDLEKGGTWIGLNQHGLFAGLTNRYSPLGYPDADLSASRGELPLLALNNTSLQQASAAVQAAIMQRHYPGFHLLLATYNAATCLAWDGQRLSTHAIDGPTFVITERSFGQTPPGREVLLNDRLQGLEEHASLETLTDILAIHQANSIDAVCVHLDGINYGTRSAVCINLRPNLEQSQLWETNSPPCQPEWTQIQLSEKY